MRNQNVLPMRDLEIFGVVKDGKFTIPEKEVHALKNGKMTDVIEIKNLRGKDIHIEKMPARLSIIQGEDGYPKLHVEPIFKEKSPEKLEAEYIIPDLNISEEQTKSFSLSKQQLNQIPDYLKGNQLTEYQKKSLAISKRVDITFPHASDELKERFYLKEDGKILNVYFTGEEEILKKKDVGFTNLLTKYPSREMIEQRSSSNLTGQNEETDHYLDR